MSMISEKDNPALRDQLESLRYPVHIMSFTQTEGCAASRKIHELLMELKTYSPFITIESYNPASDKNKLAELDIELLPATIIRTEHSAGIRFYGVPEGYEFASFIEAIKMVGMRRIDMGRDSLQKVNSITIPVHIRVFATSSCPYSPSAVVTAHRLALANPHITADMIESTQFPEFATRFGVHGVPRIVINDENAFEGSLPEDLYIDEVLRALSEAP